MQTLRDVLQFMASGTRTFDELRGFAGLEARIFCFSCAPRPHRKSANPGGRGELALFGSPPSRVQKPSTLVTNILSDHGGREAPIRHV
eukprot:1545020-Pyramimonas_sp.AAC.1